MKLPYLLAGIAAFALAFCGCNNTGSRSRGDVGFVAQLNGHEQVPSVDTRSTGTARFWLSPDATELHYKLSVSGLKNVTMAHLHLGLSGENGPPIVWIFRAEPSAAGLDAYTNGILNEGTITANDLVGPMSGKTVGELVAEIRAHNVYVNVHTRDNSDGEIRGQVE